MSRHKIFLALLALWTVAVFLWPRRLNQKEKDSAPAAVGVYPTSGAEDLYRAEVPKAPLGLVGVNFYESYQGKRRWHIHSTSAELHRKENYAFLENVAADFFSDRSGNRIETKSRYGRSRLDRQKIDLEGNVTIQSKRGYLFAMERLAYDGGTHEFTTEDPVSMKGPAVANPMMMLKGIGLIGNIDTEHFLVKKNVTAQRRLKNNEWLRINSRSGEFFTEEQRGVFVGKVRAVLPRISIESDIFELGVSEEKESILARGNVRLKQKEMVGRAESAGMEIGSSRLVLEGNATIDSKDNQIQGRRIIVYTDEDRIEVESAEGSVH